MRESAPCSWCSSFASSGVDQPVLSGYADRVATHRTKSRVGWRSGRDGCSYGWRRAPVSLRPAQQHRLRQGGSTYLTSAVRRTQASAKPPFQSSSQKLLRLQLPLANTTITQRLVFMLLETVNNPLLIRLRYLMVVRNPDSLAGHRQDAAHINGCESFFWEIAGTENPGNHRPMASSAKENPSLSLALVEPWPR